MLAAVQQAEAAVGSDLVPAAAAGTALVPASETGTSRAKRNAAAQRKGLAAAS